MDSIAGLQPADVSSILIMCFRLFILNLSSLERKHSLENRASSFLSEIRIIVAGTRTFSDYELLENKLNDFISELNQKYPDKQIVIITGAAKGADQLGSFYARSHNIPLKEFPADWHTYGRAAGPIRNQQMLDFALHEIPKLIVFWDGKSRGTKNMIDIARRYNVQTEVLVYTIDAE